MAERTGPSSAKSRKSICTPPPSKKTKQLVQARLPFSVLDPKSSPHETGSAQKKRKLSDNSASCATPKGPKVPKNDENIVVIDDDSNDKVEENVKHKSEENIKKNPIESLASKGVMDRFLVKDKTPGRTTAPSPSDSSETHQTTEVKVKQCKESSGEDSVPSASTKPEVMANRMENLSPVVVLDRINQTEKNSPEAPSTPASGSTIPSRKRTPKTTPNHVQEKKMQKLKEKEETEKLKKEEKDKKVKERQEEKERKEREKQVEKEKKDKEREDLKNKKEKERAEKEKEKEEKRKLAEEEKRKKQELKDEEKRKKLEIIEAKNAEKKQKEDEKKMLEDEKKKQEEEKNKLKAKQKAVFSNFFAKSSTDESVQKSEIDSSTFFAFQTKKDMRLAPVARALLNGSEISSLDSLMLSQQSSDLYLKELGSGRSVGSAKKTWPADDEIQIVEQDSTKATTVPAKLLQFHENYRPAYYGTWRKRSTKVNPRNPFIKDEKCLDYEVESDDEWEEEEPGESLSNSEGEEENEVGKDEDDEDGFFVPHGYLSEGEGGEDDEDDCNPEKMKAKQQAMARAFEAEMGRKDKCEALKPEYVGCCWFSPYDSDEYNQDVKLLLEYKVVPLVNSFPISVDVQIEAKAVEGPGNVVKSDKEGKPGRNYMPVPDEAIPELIRLVHGNSFSIQKVIKEFREYWHRKKLDESCDENKKCRETPLTGCIEGQTSASPDKMDTDDTANQEQSSNSPKAECSDSPKPGKIYAMSKRQLDVKIREIAAYEKRDDFTKSCWYVSSDILEKYNLKELVVPTAWKWITRAEKPKKVARESPLTPTPSGKNTPPPGIAGRNTPTASIKQFTVPNLSPQIFSPLSSKAAASSGNCKTDVLNPTPVKPTPDDSIKIDIKPKDKSQSVLLKMFNSMAEKTGDPVSKQTRAKEEPGKTVPQTDNIQSKTVLLKMFNSMAAKTGDPVSKRARAKEDPGKTVPQTDNIKSKTNEGNSSKLNENNERNAVVNASGISEDSMDVIVLD